MSRLTTDQAAEQARKIEIQWMFKHVTPVGDGMECALDRRSRPEQLFLPLTVEGMEFEDVSPSDLQDEVLHRVRNVFEYSDDHRKKNGVRLAALRAFTPLYVKAVGERKGQEYYFPLRPERTRGGVFYRILSVLRREDGTKPVKWTEDGRPVENVAMADDMLDAAQKRWRQGFHESLFLDGLEKPTINPLVENNAGQ